MVDQRTKNLIKQIKKRVGMEDEVEDYGVFPKRQSRELVNDFKKSVKIAKRGK